MVSNTIAFVGVRVGDEGKGARVFHYVKEAVNRCKLSEEQDPRNKVLVYRWHGGPNAGHTVSFKGESYKFHQIPVGVLLPEVYNLQGSGIYLNPRKEAAEIQALQQRGVAISPANLGIASNAFIILESHVEEDTPNLHRQEHTTTGNGIKQVARDKYERLGIRFAEFLDPREFTNALESLTERRGSLSKEHIEALVESYAPVREALSPFMVLQEEVFRTQGTAFKLGEGAHGFDLDVEEGLYPGVTSSHPSLVPHRPDTIVGIVKLYDSSVGHDRPFVSRLTDENLESTLRDRWGERGTTTGKNRNIGWLDLVAARHAVRSVHMDCLIGNCGDRLQDLAHLGNDVRVVVGYDIGGKHFDRWDPSFHKRSTLYGAKPILKSFKPWTRFSYGDRLSDEARAYIDFIQTFLDREFVALGTGPGENDLIEIKSLL